MNDKRYGLGNPIVSMGVLTLMAVLTTVGLLVFDKPVAAAVIAAGTAFLWLLLVIVSTVAVTTWWTRETMRAGAEIALSAQVSDDKRDVQLLKTAGDVVRSVRQSRELPALPLPQQQSDWRPAWPELDVVDVEPEER